METRKTIIGLITVFLVLGVSLAAFLLLQKSFVVQTIAVDTELPQRIIEAPGDVRLIEMGEISAPYSGLIETVRVKAGDSVAAGQPLFSYSQEAWKAELERIRLEIRSLQGSLSGLDENRIENLRQSRLALERSLQTLESLRREQRESDLAISNQLGKYAADRTDLESLIAKQAAEVAKLETLFQGGAVAQKDVDEARNKLDQLETQAARLENEERQFSEVMAPLKKEGFRERLLQAGRDVEEARVDLRKAGESGSEELMLREKLRFSRQEAANLEKALAHSTVTAPYSGRVLSVGVSAGQSVSQGASLAELGDIHRLEVILRVPAASSHRLATDLPVRLEVEEIHNPFSGRIDAIASQIESGVIEARVRVELGEDLLRAGMQVKAEIITAGDDVLILPPQAVLERRVPDTSPILRKNEDTVHYIFVVNPHTRKVSPFRVKIGSVGPGYVEVITIPAMDCRVVVGDEKALARLARELDDWERKQMQEMRAVFEPEE